MNILVWNFVLALIWATATAQFTLVNFVLGFVLGFFILWYVRESLGPTKYFFKMSRLFGFMAFFLFELVRANLRVAYDVITPTYYMRPGVVAIPLDAQTDLEITLLANLISLTPGTLSLDVSEDRKVLFIHSMFIKDPEKMRQEIKGGFERRLLEVLR